MCVHQMAVLQHYYPGQAAGIVMLTMLGSRLGMADGCNPSAMFPLQPLIQKLEELQQQSDGAPQQAADLRTAATDSQAQPLQAAQPDSTQPLQRAGASACALSMSDSQRPAAHTPEATDAADEDMLPVSFSPSCQPALLAELDSADVTCEPDEAQQAERARQYIRLQAAAVQSAVSDLDELPLPALKGLSNAVAMCAKHMQRARTNCCTERGALLAASFLEPQGQESRRHKDCRERARRHAARTAAPTEQPAAKRQALQYAAPSLAQQLGLHPAGQQPDVPAGQQQQASLQPCTQQQDQAVQQQAACHQAAMQMLQPHASSVSHGRPPAQSVCNAAHEAVLAPLMPRRLPTAGGVSGAWKRHGGLRGVLQDPCFDDNAPKAPAAASAANDEYVPPRQTRLQPAIDQPSALAARPRREGGQKPGQWSFLLEENDENVGP